MSFKLTDLRVSPETFGNSCNIAKNGSIAFPLTSNTPYSVDVPQWQDNNGKLHYASWVRLSGTGDFWVSYLSHDPSDLVVNGGFDTDTAWDHDLSFSISGGKAFCDGSEAEGFAYITQTIPADKQVDVGGCWYRVTYTLSGTLIVTEEPYIQAVVCGVECTQRNTNNTFTQDIYIPSEPSNFDIKIIFTNTVSGYIDNFSVIPIAKAAIPSSADLSGNAPELNPTMRDLSGVSQMSFISEAATKISLSFYK